MARFDLEADMSDEQQPAPQPLRGAGTSEDPFRPSAFEDEITKIAEHAHTTDQPAYCDFEGSLFRINPDGTYERSHKMPSLRDDIEDIFEEVLQQVREAWSKSK